MPSSGHSHRVRDDIQRHYICGQCGDKQRYLQNEEPPIPCPDCGWTHKDRKKYELPSKIKLDLGRY